MKLPRNWNFQVPEVRIDLEWEESPHVRSPELSATWARLAIFADGRPVTKVEDHRAGSIRNRICASVPHCRVGSEQLVVFVARMAAGPL